MLSGTLRDTQASKSRRGIRRNSSRSRKQNYITHKKREGGAGDYRGRSPGSGGAGRAAFPLGRRFPLCLAFLSAPHFLDAAILSSSAGRGNKGAAAMSEAGILYRGSATWLIPVAPATLLPLPHLWLRKQPSRLSNILGAPKTLSERPHLAASLSSASKRWLFFPHNTLLRIPPNSCYITEASMAPLAPNKKGNVDSG